MRTGQPAGPRTVYRRSKSSALENRHSCVSAEPARVDSTLDPFESVSHHAHTHDEMRFILLHSSATSPDKHRHATPFIAEPSAAQLRRCLYPTPHTALHWHLQHNSEHPGVRWAHSLPRIRAGRTALTSRRLLAGSHLPCYLGGFVLGCLVAKVKHAKEDVPAVALQQSFGLRCRRTLAPRFAMPYCSPSRAQRAARGRLSRRAH